MDILRMSKKQGALGVLMAIAIAGCNTTTSAKPNTTTDGGADAAVASDTTGLTCLAVLQCAAACAESDPTCSDACLARGDAEAQAKANTFAECFTKNNCQDRACLDANCSDSFAACLARPAQPGGAPISGDAPPGSVPPSFVGTWKYTSTYGSADNFTFNADGTARRTQLSVASLSGCTSSTSFEDSGTVVFDPAGTGFKFFITKSTTTASNCGQSTTTPGTTGAFDFEIEPIPALGPNKYWFFWVQGCPVTAEVDKRIQCGHEFDL
jgi:hypothetical protein